MKIKYADRAYKQMRAIAKYNPKTAKRILNKIERFAAKPTGKHDIKALKGKYGTFLRLRVGAYRIIFETVEDEMRIYEIRQRQEAY